MWLFPRCDRTYPTPFSFSLRAILCIARGGRVIVGTPNVLRPANLVRALLGKLQFPMTIGHFEKILDYVHAQEFHEQQLKLMLQEVGFVNVAVIPLYFGPSMLNVSFSDYPQEGVGPTLAHFLLATGRKPS